MSYAFFFLFFIKKYVQNKSQIVKAAENVCKKMKNRICKKERKKTEKFHFEIDYFKKWRKENEIVSLYVVAGIL